jgi:hypothetical protein
VGGLTLPADPAQATTLPQRLSQRKTALKVQLSAPQIQKITKGCSLAQTGLQDIKTKDATAAEKRFQAYSALASQLAITIDHLERQGIDTTKLKIQQTTFKGAINKYLSDAANYKSAMDDVVVMDCKNDTAGFEATLLSARQLRTQLAADASAIKAEVPAITKAIEETKQSLIQSLSASEKGGDR